MSCRILQNVTLTRFSFFSRFKNKKLIFFFARRERDREPIAMSQMRDFTSFIPSLLAGRIRDCEAFVFLQAFES